MEASEKPPQAQLRVRAMEPTAEEMEVFRRAFEENGSQKDPAVLRWQYLDNPFGPVMVHTFVEDVDGGERVAAMHPWMPVRFRVDGRVRPASQTVDILTDERYRGQGLFVRLAREAYARSGPLPLDFTYGFPNDKLYHSYYTKLGWAPLDPLPFLVRPVRTGYFLSRAPKVGGVLGKVDLPLPRPRKPRLAPGEALEPVTTFGPEFDALWEAFASAGGVGVAVHRDAAYLSWRTARPGEGYRTVALRRQGALEGFVTFCVRGKHGGRIGYVMELLHRPGNPAAGKALLAHAVREMADDGADAILAWSLDHAPNRAAYRAAGFLPLPEKLRPIRIYFGVKPLDEADQPLLADRSRWYVSYLDSDTV